MNPDVRARPDRAAAPPNDPTAGRASAEFDASPTYRRRSVLRTVGGVAAAGLLAGCSGFGGGAPEDQDGDGATSVDEWLADTGNYDGVVDGTDDASVTVEVGARGNHGANAFAPAAVEVSPGTTVTWEWVDGHHNVVSTDGEVDSGQPERNATFEHTFETAATFLYYCEPHRSIAMKGAVVVSGAGTDASGGTPGEGE